MRFEWDITKAKSNLAEHGVAFEDGERAFEDVNAVYEKDWVVDGEQRWHMTGAVGYNNLLLVVHTVNYDNEEVVRIISARRANNKNEGIIRRPFMPGRPFSAEEKERLEALSAMPDEDIDYSDIPPLPDDFFKNAVRGWLPLEKRTVNLALDAEVYDWLMREGQRNARVINHVLRREMQQAMQRLEQNATQPASDQSSMSKAS